MTQKRNIIIPPPCRPCETSLEYYSLYVSYKTEDLYMYVDYRAEEHYTYGTPTVTYYPINARYSVKTFMSDIYVIFMNNNDYTTSIYKNITQRPMI